MANSTTPLFRAHADFAGPMDGRWYLIVVDAYSKWPEVFTMTTTTATATISLFKEIIARHGSMEKLVTDNGPQWTSAQFAEFRSSEAIDHIRTAPYMPMSNGLAERFVDTFKRALSKSHKSNVDNIQEILRHAQFTSTVWQITSRTTLWQAHATSNLQHPTTTGSSRLPKEHHDGTAVQ